MSRHIVTIILLLAAAVAFVLRFLVADKWQDSCDIAAFALPTVAALVEIFLAEKNSKETEKQIAELKEKAENAVYAGETIGRVPDVDITDKMNN
ncbi:hypothetical protein SAMN04487901_106138 [Prevotella communis]|uniref:Uncharacterized protein n=1 Tax=Prevotella communis TaxID=2913614 RepID=A0A1G7VVD0_9BACT|nr:hypothetical protein [Prevotella communis]SDG63369.1 hypothetical protein SAMN04487901_106138 [Prevotella communis]